MAGKYTPKRGIFAGKTFSSYRQYLNAKSEIEGYKNYNERVGARKELVEQSELLDVEFSETKEYPNGKKIDIYVSDFLADILNYAILLPPNYVVSIIAKIVGNYGASKSNVIGERYVTLINFTKVSLLKKRIKDNKEPIESDIEEKLDGEQSIVEVIMWVKKP